MMISARPKHSLRGDGQRPTTQSRLYRPQKAYPGHRHHQAQKGHLVYEVVRLRTIIRSVRNLFSQTAGKIPGAQRPRNNDTQMITLIIYTMEGQDLQSTTQVTWIDTVEKLAVDTPMVKPARSHSVDLPLQLDAEVIAPGLLTWDELLTTLASDKVSEAEFKSRTLHHGYKGDVNEV
jgi:hypothetical protein